MKRLRGKRSFGIKFFLAVTCVVFACLAVLASPFFYITEIEFAGSTVYSDAALTNELGLFSGRNDSILYRSGRTMETNLERLPYIKSAYVTKQFPNTLSVRIVERIPTALVFDDKLGLYLTIDIDGYVLDILSFPRENKPVMTGIRLAGYSIGQPLVSEGSVNLMPTVTRLSTIFDRYGLTNVARADVSNLNAIRLFINDIIIHIGSMQDADAKILMAMACLRELEITDRGTLFVYDVDNVVFQFATNR